MFKKDEGLLLENCKLERTSRSSDFGVEEFVQFYPYLPHFIDLSIDIMTGIRLAVGRAIVGMVVAEMFTAMTGLGGAIVYYSNAFATDKLFVVIILLALLGVALTEGVKFLEVRLAPWKETERAS